MWDNCVKIIAMKSDEGVRMYLTEILKAKMQMIWIEFLSSVLYENENLKNILSESCLKIIEENSKKYKFTNVESINDISNIRKNSWPIISTLLLLRI